MAFVFDQFDNNEVYDAGFIKETSPSLFRGKNKAISSIIQSQNIPQEEYVFASISKNVYKRLSYDSVYKSKRVLIKKEWVDKNVPGFGCIVVKKPDYPPLPPIIELPEEKTLKDANGASIPMTICGEFHIDKMFFRAKDVEKMLELSSLASMLSENHNSNFTEKVHFVKFDVSSVKCKDKQIIKNNVALYLTHHGLIRLLFVTRSQYSIHFQKWALNILFTHQYGDKTQKIELANDLLETTNVKAIKSFLKTNITSMPCIYLFELGKTKDLRNTFNISDIHDDESIVYKYGLTSDLARRTSEHASTFKKLGIKINLKHYVTIDCGYLQKAENELKRYYTNMNFMIDNKDFKEVVSIPLKYTPQLVEDFKDLDEKYSGKLTEIKAQMERLRDENLHLKNSLHEKDMMYNEMKEMKDQTINILLKVQKNEL